MNKYVIVRHDREKPEKDFDFLGGFWCHREKMWTTMAKYITGYPSKEEAENEAFEIVARNPRLIGQVTVVLAEEGDPLAGYINAKP